jgi:hypothetical protein
MSEAISGTSFVIGFPHIAVLMRATSYYDLSKPPIYPVGQITKTCPALLRNIFRLARRANHL